MKNMSNVKNRKTLKERLQYHKTHNYKHSYNHTEYQGGREAGGSRTQGHPELCGELQISLDWQRPCPCFLALLPFDFVLLGPCLTGRHTLDPIPAVRESCH